MRPSKIMMDVRWAFISTATASLAHFLLRIILGRVLGTEGLGIYTLTFTIYLFGVQFAGFGIGSAITKYVAEFIEDRNAIRDHTVSGAVGSLITGTLMGAVLFLLAPVIAGPVFHIPEMEGLIRLTALCFPFLALQKAVLGVLNGLRSMKRFALLNILQNTAVVLSSVALVLFINMGVLGAVVGLVLPTVIISILSPILIREHLRIEGPIWNRPVLHTTTVFGLYIVMGNSIAWLNTQVDNLFIGYYLGPTEVGIYTVAALFSQALILVPSAIQNVTAPIMSTLHGRGDMEGIREVFRSVLKRSLILSLITGGVIAITGPLLIPLFFTSDYDGAYIPLLILLIGNILGATFISVGATLSSIGQVHLPFRIGAVSATLNIVLNILLIPFLGMNGAAISTSTTLVANFILSLAVIRMFIGDDRRRRSYGEIA